jgi:transposase
VGENPPFSPQYTNQETAQEAIEAIIHQRPEHFGLTQTRWTLIAILQVCGWTRLKTLSGTHQILKRLKIHRKRGRAHLHSPDLDYVGKLRHVWLWIREVRLNPEKQVLLFSDEFTFYRQPTLSYDYERAGPSQPLAELGHRSNLTWRIAGALNAWTGQITYANHSHFTLKLLVDFYQQIAQTYPNAQMIYLVVDNWPIHFHPDVLAALHDPTIAWPLKLPSNWPAYPSKQARRLDLPIRLVPLPTYAPWNNPIEKLWLLLKKQVLHLHRFSDDWDGLKLRVNNELDQYVRPSPDLLRFVGLQDPLHLYHALFQQT